MALRVALLEPTTQAAHQSRSAFEFPLPLHSYGRPARASARAPVVSALPAADATREYTGSLRCAA